MRILCVSAQLPGHLDWGGYLATAAELARRGHDMLWTSGIAVAEQVHAPRTDNGTVPCAITLTDTTNTLTPTSSVTATLSPLTAQLI